MTPKLRQILKWLPIKRRRSLTPGIAIFGINLFIETRRSQNQSFYALEQALKLNAMTVLDVGSGDGEHARMFATHGAEVDCIDYGTSIYANQAKEFTPSQRIKTLNIDFNAFIPSKQYDLVWASHVLEHQRNPGIFIEQLIRCCHPNGRIIITVPDPHRIMCGGHLSSWTPGLLAYNIVMCGIDLQSSAMIRGSHEFSISFQPKRFSLPQLSYDYGDLRKLQPYLPSTMSEGGDSWIKWGSKFL